VLLYTSCRGGYVGTVAKRGSHSSDEPLAYRKKVQDE
jgi:hypothetical protein